MERESSGNRDLQRLLEAINSSDVVESRVQLVGKLGDLDLNDGSDLPLLVESLATFWEDFTCLDISQCNLNKTILLVAAKYVDSDLSRCLVPFLSLEIKASTWCGKHLKMTLMSTGESQEDEHSDHFFQLLLDFLSMSTSSMMALAKSSVWDDKKTMAAVEKIVMELLNLVEDVVTEIKRINFLGSEILKVAQTIVDSVIRLWRECSSSVGWDVCDARFNNDKEMKIEELEIADHFISITKFAVKKLCQLGVVAAKDGGQLVNILNASWKGVVILLQQIRGTLKEMVHVQDIILSLISLVNEHLGCAAEVWSSSLKETVSATEARRTFLPVKFYLLHMVKIFSLYAHETYQIHQDMALFLVLISTFKILLSSDKLLDTASEVFSDLLENSLLELLLCLLNSDEVKHELKFEFLDWIFLEECGTKTISHVNLTSPNRMYLMVTILSGRYEDLPRAGVLLLGRVAVFHTLLKYSVGLREEVKTKIAQKLGWLLCKIIDEEVYSSILDMKILLLSDSGKRTEWAWHPMFSALLDSLKTFMIVAFSSCAWEELEDFLLQNLLHPHFLCWEIVTELWHFLVKHAEASMVKGIFDKLCSILKLVTSPGSVYFAGSPLRKMARSLCRLLHGNDTSIADHVYGSLVGVGVHQFSPEIFSALVLEGFPLNSLSESIRSFAKQKLVTDYFDFINTCDSNFLTGSSPDACGLPVFALSAALQTQQVRITDIEMTLKFLATMTRSLLDNVDKPIPEKHTDLFCQALWNFSYMEHLYESSQMVEVLAELKKLFLSGISSKDLSFHQCKPYLALFMGGLGNMEMSENNDCAKTSGVCELYHMILRERHWALAHLAIASFGSFAARTSCNQLWRFVPENAALAYDLQLANEPSEETFMMELKAVLEKEMALLTVEPSFEQYELLRKEGLILRQIVQKISAVPMDTILHDNKEIGDDNESRPSKKRKLPEGIDKGMELVQCGLKIIGDSISRWQPDHSGSSEFHENFSTQFSCLEDMVAHLKKLVSYN